MERVRRRSRRYGPQAETTRRVGQMRFMGTEVHGLSEPTENGTCLCDIQGEPAHSPASSVACNTSIQVICQTPRSFLPTRSFLRTEGDFGQSAIRHSPTKTSMSSLCATTAIDRRPCLCSQLPCKRTSSSGKLRVCLV
jgi:hypothetical protein